MTLHTKIESEALDGRYLSGRPLHIRLNVATSVTLWMESKAEPWYGGEP